LANPSTSRAECSSKSVSPVTGAPINVKSSGSAACDLIKSSIVYRESWLFSRNFPKDAGSNAILVSVVIDMVSGQSSNYFCSMVRDGAEVYIVQ
jgi:hypothetical protein